MECSEVEGSQRLVKFTRSGDLGKRTILAGVKGLVVLENLIGLQVVVLANLEPKKMMGMESQGMMIMGVEGVEGIGGIEGVEGEKISLLLPQNKVKPGTEVE